MVQMILSDKTRTHGQSESNIHHTPTHPQPQSDTTTTTTIKEKKGGHKETRPSDQHATERVPILRSNCSIDGDPSQSSDCSDGTKRDL